VIDLQGKRALVTGGSRGIGAGIARLLAQAGAELVLGYRADERSAQATVEAIEATGGRARAIAANLVRPEEVKALFAEAGGPLDVLVHCAALGAFKDVLAVRPAQWDLTFEAGPRAFLLCVQQAVPLLRPGGAIVAVSSLGSQRVVPAYGAHGASKAALEALVRGLALELLPRGIRVNAVSGGLVDTDGVRHHPGFEAMRTEAERRSPAGRIGTPEDIARAVLFLASPLAGWIVGQTVVADGGASLSM
jgi:enoyl-[acyl-carrier protein] reductase III